jgi:hypothetical protein
MSFVQQFAGQGGTPNPHEAVELFDRFTSNHPKDGEFKAEELHAGASEHLQQMPAEDFHQAVQSAYASATPDQQHGLMSSLTSALRGRGIDPAGLLGMAGGALPSLLNPSQYAQLANATRQQQPEALHEVVRQQPWFVKAMGNPVVMGALGVVASRMVRNRMGPPSEKRAGTGLLGKLL